MRTRSRVALALGATLVAALGAAPLTSAVASGDTTYSPPKIKHVWNIILENKSYEAAFTGLNQNSYLWKTLPVLRELLARQYYGTGHFSQDNYLSLVSGQGASPGPQSDCPLYNETGPVSQVADGQYKIKNLTPAPTAPTSTARRCPAASSRRQVPTLFNQLDAANVSYKGYMQDMGVDPAREPATCGNPLGSQPGPAVVDPGGSEGPYARTRLARGADRDARRRVRRQAQPVRLVPLHCSTTATAPSTSCRWRRTCSRT